MKENARFVTLSVLTKIIRSCLWMGVFGVFAHSCAAADDDKGADENAMILRSGRRIPKTTSVSSSLQLQTYPSQVVDDERQVRKRRRVEKKEEENHFVEMSPIIPPVAQGYEEIYRRFLNGALIYKPDPNSDVGMVTFLIRELANPLEGTFDLSRCGDERQYLSRSLSISTGYRKGKKLKNANKFEIWIVPWFLVAAKLNSTAAHFRPIMNTWNQEKAPVGLFWSWGRYENTMYQYLTSQSMGELSNNNFYEKCQASYTLMDGVIYPKLLNPLQRGPELAMSSFVCRLT